MNLIAFQSPSYRRYYVGSTGAVNALWILRVVLSWLAWDVSHSATFVGIIAALSLMPTIFSGPFFGVMMDRINIMRAAYGTNIGMMLAALIMIIAIRLDILNEPFLIVIGLFIGVVASAHHPMRLSLGPRLVQHHQISSVSALASLNFNLARIIAPFIAGVIIETMSITVALIMVLILYTPNLFIYATLHPRALDKPARKLGIFASMGEGMIYIWHHHYLRLILITAALYAVSVRSIMEILPVIADGKFNMGAVGLGQLGAAIGAGSLAAAFFKTMGTSQRISALSGKNLAIAAVGFLFLALMTNANSWPLALFSAACIGFAGTYLGITFQSEVQSDLPDGMRGRVMSMWGVVTLGSTSIGALIVGWFADQYDLGITGLFITALSMLALLWISRSRP